MVVELRLPDGLDTIQPYLTHVVEMIVSTIRWVHPDTFRALPIWYPETARRLPQYDARWEQQYVNGQRSAPRTESNEHAARALVDALDIRGSRPRHWDVCHIWGYDDATHSKSGSVVCDRRFYSCVGNMVLLPTPLKGFTDTVPDIKAMLRTCAYYLYGWVCEHHEAQRTAESIRSGKIPEGYPYVWPTAERRVLPPGTAPYSPRVAQAVEKRKCEIATALFDFTLDNYPHDEVQDVLDFWKVEL